MMGHSSTSAQSQIAAEHERKVIGLRRAGLSWVEIGRKMGMSHEGARGAFKRVMARNRAAADEATAAEAAGAAATEAEAEEGDDATRIADQTRGRRLWGLPEAASPTARFRTRLTPRRDYAAHSEQHTGERMVRLFVRDRESIQEAVRRFRKLVERSGLKREMRRRQYYEKPSETKRRARLRAERRAHNARQALGLQKSSR